jgi:lipopolysaccharide exporter
LFSESICSMTFATAARQGKIARLTAVDFISGVIQIFLQIILAIWLRSYWAICYAMIIGGIFKSALSYYMFGQGLHRWRLSRLRLLEAWSFGKHFVGSSLIEIVISQTDKLFLARFMPISLYGQYVLAGNLAAGPTSLVLSFNSRILFPAFSASRTQDIEHRASTYYNTGRWLRQAFAFGSGGLIALSPLIVEALYDERYASVSRFLQLLSLITLVRFSASISTDYLVATDSPKHYLRLNLARMITLVMTGFVGYHYMGAIGIVLALLVAECVGQIYNWASLFGKGILSLRSELLFWSLAALGYMLGWCINGFSFRYVVPLFKAGLGT